MASSNRHWPSMFKSKPQSDQTHPTPYSHTSEDRSPEPKPRWNPKPEQIRILESIFNSGRVNPPREDIRSIRIQLQEYGQVGDANVFYWFQNRKSRSKHKQRYLTSKTKPTSSASKTLLLPDTSSSSSSEKSSPPAACAFQPPNLALPNQIPPDPFVESEAFWFSDPTPRDAFVDRMTCQDLAPITFANSTVFINDVAFEVSMSGPVNVGELFGDEWMLVDSTGQPVQTDQWGFSAEPLEHGSFYYLVRTPDPSSYQNVTPADLMVHDLMYYCE